MLRLIIVDDERIIRETIRSLIDWESLGIQVVGVCRDGLEAYDAIVDEYPDIVLTDIKMPGLSGLELIQRITQTYDKIEFVILSGYGEFSLAAEAMKYGVHHYLLKPCNEKQIVEVMRQVQKDCYKNRALGSLRQQQLQVSNNLRRSLVRNMIMEAVSSRADLKSLIQFNAQFLDFENVNYEMCLFTFDSTEKLQQAVQNRKAFWKNMPPLTIHEYYAKNLFLVFFESYEASYEQFDEQIQSLLGSGAERPVRYQRISYRNLGALLKDVVAQMRRFGRIYSVIGSEVSSICNFSSLVEQIDGAVRNIRADSPESSRKTIEEFREVLSCVDNPKMLRLLITNILLRQPVQDFFDSSTEVTEFLLQLETQEDCEQIRARFYAGMAALISKRESESAPYKSFIENTMTYVDAHLDDPNLSLKWIANHYLYMNVDYVSKQFVRQTGEKFSNYLNQRRIGRAKDLLSRCGSEKISTVAEQVGCGEHPQYFSQLFKKYTGITPSEYVRQTKETAEGLSVK